MTATIDFDCPACDKHIKAPDRLAGKRVKCPKCGSKKVERHWSSIFVETSKKS